MNKCLSVIILGIIFCISYTNAQPTDQDAEYRKIIKEYTLNRDGSCDFHFRKEIRLLTHFSFHRLYGETFIIYNPRFQKLQINESYTVMAEGKKVVTPDNAFNEVLPGFARDVAAYNHLREMVVTHTGTEIGAVITLDYTIHSDGGFMPFLSGMEEIGESAPVRDMEIIIRTPVEVSLQYRMLNNRTAPEITEIAGQRTYRWSLLNLPALPRTPNQDPERKAMLQFSIAKDMSFAYFSFINQPGFTESPGPEALKKAEAAIQDRAGDIDKILALQELVIDEVKLAEIPLAYTGYRIRTPRETWMSANASQLEKAVLLSRMLVAAGINAYPVATVPNGWFSNAVGTPSVFDGYLVQVNPRKLGRIYLSVTQKQSQNLIYDLLDKTIILLDPAMESMRTFQEKPEANFLKMEAELEISPDKGLSGELELHLEGIVNPFYKIHRDSTFVKSVITGEVTASQLGNPEFQTLSELRTSAVIPVGPALLKTDYHGYIFLELPRFKNGFDGWALYQFTGTGNTPVKFDHHLWEEYIYKIRIPEGYSLFTPPVDTYFKNVLGVLSVKIAQKGQEITVHREFELSHDVVTSDNMDELKQMIEAWENGNWRRLVVRAP